MEATGVGVGVADGRFAAAVAARRAGTGGVVVAPGTSAGFLERLPVAWLGHLGEADAELVGLFARLGLARLGDLAAVPASDVLAGSARRSARPPAGRRARRSSCRMPATPRRSGGWSRRSTNPSSWSQPLVFVGKQLADELVARLSGEGRVCTRLVVTAETEHGERSERAWYRAAGLSAPAMVERVRWQLDGWMGSGEPTAGVVLLRLVARRGPRRRR